MISLSSTLLFAASASAQLTTSFWAIGLGGDSENHLGYDASVINVQDSQTTLELSYDNRTDTEYAYFGASKFTMTIGPSIWEYYDVGTASAGPSADFLKYHCEKNNPSVETANGTCTLTIGHGIATSNLCGTMTFRPQTYYSVVTRTYSGSGTFSVGVETVTEVTSRPPRPNRSTPAWCTESKASDANYVTQDSQPNTEFATYQVVITAGTEKLKATQGASASASGATPTGSNVPTGSNAPTASVAVSSHSGAAMPMRTAAPVIVGLGAAIAAFVV